MNNTKYTPGPWHVGLGYRVIGANSQRVCVADNTDVTDGLANAHLIASAPELLNMLIAAICHIEAGHKVPASEIAAMNKVVAKAKGES